MDYIPIDCNYYDELEALATRKVLIEIRYFNNHKKEASTDTSIKDFFIENKVEYMLLENGLKIRLDYLISVNGKKLPENGSCYI